jgi:hypothetical protein
MKRGIVEVVRIGKNLNEMLPSYSLYPWIADDVLLVIDSEKTQAAKPGSRPAQIGSCFF